MKLLFSLTSFLIFSSLFAQTANDSLKVFSDGSHYSTKSSHKIINPITIAAGYTAICFLSYRYVDDEVQKIAMANQNKVVYNTFKTIGYTGLGETNIFITAGTGISALITKNKQLEKATILLVGSHLINDFVTHQFKVSFQRHRPNTGDPYNTFDWREGTKTNESFISTIHQMLLQPPPFLHFASAIKNGFQLWHIQRHRLLGYQEFIKTHIGHLMF